MESMTRRQVLKMLSLLLPATAMSCRRDDVFDEERVCVHVYSHGIAVPEPLLRRYEHIPPRGKQGGLFQIGIPELLVCTAPTSLITSFQYFWPLTREEFQQAQNRTTVQFQKTELSRREDIESLRMYVKELHTNHYLNEERTALLVVFNDYTKYWIADVLAIWRDSPLDEVVIFKDPTRSPYLCDYPALQKGFRRPP